MDYTKILKDIKPSESEKSKIKEISYKLIDFINKLAKDKKIDVEAILVGSVAKETYLSGKSDIDIFIKFPLNTKEAYLKEKGLEIAYITSENFNGEASEHYASHPYLTSKINGYEVDFVPCYDIIDASELKSAVDRTILHTKYMEANLNESQKDEVLLLKKFMDQIKTYGSEFKVGGFAGYLCEMLILEYGSFECVLEKASNWKFGEIIDLEDYNTSNLFNDPLIAIDPTDKNRNVGAALRLNKMCEFIQGSRNYINSNKKEKFFYDLNKEIRLEDIINDFKKRGSKFITLKFKIPKIPTDTLHPQLNKTLESLASKLESEDFSVYKYDYWTDEKEIAIFLLEMNVYKQNNIKIHYGPKIFSKKHCENFLKAHKDKNSYIIDDFIVFDEKRKFLKAEDYIKYVLTNDNAHLIKLGKNLKNNLINSYELIDLFDLLKFISEKNYFNDFLLFLDDYLYIYKYLNR